MMRLLSIAMLVGCLLFQAGNLIGGKKEYDSLGNDETAKRSYLMARFDKNDKILKKIVKLTYKLAYQSEDSDTDNNIKSKINIATSILYEFNNLEIDKPIFCDFNNLENSSISSFVSPTCHPIAVGLNTVLNSFYGTLATDATIGHIEGVISAPPIVKDVGDAYDVTLKVGDQTFRGIDVRPTADGVMSLMSGDSILSFDYEESVTDITDAETFTAALNTLVGWDDDRATVKFQSASASLALAPGFSRNSTSYIAGFTASTGKYALSYDGIDTFKLIAPDGSRFTKTVISEGSQTITFDNGFNFTLEENFKLTNTQPQLMIKVTRDDEASLSLKVDPCSPSYYLKWKSIFKGSLKGFIEDIEKRHGTKDHHNNIYWAVNYIADQNSLCEACEEKIGIDYGLVARIKAFLAEHCKIN